MKYAPIDLNKIRDLEADIQQNIAHVRKFVACDIEHSARGCSIMVWPSIVSGGCSRVSSR